MGSKDQAIIIDSTLLVITLVCIVSSSSIVHEYGSRFLDTAFLLGSTINVRALSCAAHAVGLASGFGIAALFAQACSAFLKKTANALSFFLLQGILVVAFYGSFAAWTPIAIVGLQVPVSALTAIFFVGLAHYASPFSRNTTLALVAICVGVPVFITQGLFGAIGSMPLGAMATTHLALLAIGGACYLSLRKRQDSPSSIEALSSVYRAQLDMAAAKQSGEDGTRPWLLIWIVIFFYGAVFGFYHVIPLGLPTPVSFGFVSAPIVRISSNLLGAGIAAAVLATSFSSASLDSPAIWNRFYRLVFPLAVLAGLLIPFTRAQGYLLSITCSEAALFYFDMILALGCVVICKTLRTDASIVFAHAFFARSLGFMAGNIAGGIVHETCQLTNDLLSCIGVVTFTLLFAITFNANGDKYAKTVWGILPKEDPKSRYDRQMHETCRLLAKEFQLTERETQTLELLALNKRPKEISDELVLSIATIRTYVQGIYNKLDVHSHDELMQELHRQQTGR